MGSMAFFRTPPLDGEGQGRGERLPEICSESRTSQVRRHSVPELHPARNRIPNPRQYRLDIRRHLIISEPQYEDVFFDEVLISLRVVFLEVVVNGSIDFDTNT